MGVEVARRGGQQSAGPGPCCSRDTLCSRKRPVWFALLPARLERSPNSVPFALFGLSEKSKSQTGSLSLHRSCSIFLSDSEVTQRGREIRDPEID